MHAVGKVGAAWAVPGVHAPHDMVAVASPVRLAGKERPLALLIAETWEAGNSRLHKFILLPEGTPNQSALTEAHQSRPLHYAPVFKAISSWQYDCLLYC